MLHIFFPHAYVLYHFRITHAKYKGGGGVDFSTSIKRLFNSLMIPYICMNLFCLLVFGIVEFCKGQFCYTLFKSHIWAIILGLGYNIGPFKPVCPTMWFFYVMFIIKILYIIFPNSRVSKIIQVIICFILVKMFTYYNIDTYIPLDSAIMSYPFFLVGTEYKQLLNREVKFNVHFAAIILFVLLANYFISSYNGRCDIDTMKHGKFYGLFLCTGVATSYSLLAVCSCINIQLVSLKDFLNNICNGAPLIVGLNLLVITVFKTSMLHFVKQWCCIYGIVLGIVIIMTFYPLIIFTKKYCPIILGYRK